MSKKGGREREHSILSDLSVLAFSHEQESTLWSDGLQLHWTTRFDQRQILKVTELGMDYKIYLLASNYSASNVAHKFAKEGGLM